MYTKQTNFVWEEAEGSKTKDCFIKKKKKKVM